MTDKDLREIRRRFRPDKNNILNINGCIVNGEHQIISRFSQALANSSEDENEKLLSIMKKVLSGGVGTNLNEIEFSARQTMEDEHHKLLMTLKNSSLKDEAALDLFFNKAISSIHLDGSYAILLAYDNYDVFTYSSDNEKQDSSSVFSYFVCAVCPIKASNSNLYFREYDNTFRMLEEHVILSAPELGFMFPLFDDRSANIYGTLYYTKNVADLHPDFIQEIFNTEVPMSSCQKKENLGACLKETLADDCDFEVIRSMHEQVAEQIEQHKAVSDEEPLTLSKNTFTTILEYCGVPDEKVSQFSQNFDMRFGKDDEIAPKSIIDVTKFELKTPDVSIKVNPDRTDLVSSQIINGEPYILIRADDGVEINGININIK